MAAPPRPRPRLKKTSEKRRARTAVSHGRALWVDGGSVRDGATQYRRPRPRHARAGLARPAARLLHATARPARLAAADRAANAPGPPPRSVLHLFGFLLRMEWCSSSDLVFSVVPGRTRRRRRPPPPAVNKQRAPKPACIVSQTDPIHKVRRRILQHFDPILYRATPRDHVSRGSDSRARLLSSLRPHTGPYKFPLISNVDKIFK